MSLKSIVIGALVGLSISLSAHAQTIAETQKQLQLLQQERNNLSEKISSSVAEQATIQAQIISAEKQPLPEEAEYQDAKAAAEKATTAFYDDASLNNKALRDKQLFKLKLAEQKYEKATGQLDKLRQEKTQLAATENQLRSQLKSLDTRIGDYQKRIITLINKQVERSKSNQDVTALLSGGNSSKKLAKPEPISAVATEASTMQGIDSEGKAWSGFVVIVNPRLDIVPDIEILKDLFLDKENSIKGVGRVTPINALENSDSYTSFAMNILKMNQRELSKYWAKIMFTGKGEIPKSLGNPEDIKRFIASNENAIGYIPASSLDSSVKAVMSF